MKLNQKLTVLVFVFALAVSGITSFVLYRTAADQVMKDIRRRLLDIVAISAANLDGELHATLADPSQEGGNAYISFRATLQKIRNASRDIHFVYTMCKGPESGIVFAVDAEIDPEKTAHLGEKYTTPSKLLAASFFELKHPVVEADFYTDEWGTWLSGYAPFFRKDGTRAGVIGIDISASTVKEYQQLLLMHAGITFLCILPFILIAGFLTGRKIAGPIIMMKEGAERIGHGDLDHRIMVGRSDEIGILAESLNETAAKLKAGKNELENLAKKYRNIFDHATEGIFQTAPEGRLITANPALARMMGYPSVQSMMESVTDLENQFYADPKDRRIFMESLEKEDQVNNFQTVFKRRDGTVFPVELNARLIAEKGEQKLFEGMVLDITARLEKEMSEKKRQAAEAASQAKSEFLANMSHEIRTPLNAVMGLTGLLSRTSLTDRQQEYLHKIVVSSKSLLAVINDILDFSKIEAGRLDLESTDFSLYEVMANLSEMFAFKAFDKDIEFAVHLEENVPAALVGDPVRLGQILINLTGNAIKFTNQGEVVVSVENTAPEEGCGSEKACLKFLVKDTGVGIDPARIESIFQSFTQADTSTTRQFGGTGLGLAISSRLVRLMGGAIAVDSLPGQGSTFSFTARFDRQPPEKEIKPDTPMDLRGLRVLIVDDNKTARDILADIITTFQMEAVIAGSGEAALGILSEEKNLFDLVLMDWKMPGMNGLDTAKRIKRKLEIPKIPIICMISAYGREDLIGQAEKSFLDAFLHKPVNQSLLFDCIMGLFGRKSSMITPSGTNTPGPGPDKPRHLSGGTVLLVEDNMINQEVAREWLESEGVKVETAENGHIALEKLETSVYDVVLMDIQMPEMDGFEATARIRALERFKDLPIIAMTAHALKGDREKCIGAGMNDYLSKPIDPEMMFAVLAKWISPGEQTAAGISVKKKPETRVLPGFTLPGIEVETGLFRSNNNVNLYKRLLNSFLSEYRSAVDDIASALAGGDMETVLRKAHSIKGVGANLGAMELSGAAAGVEADARQGTLIIDAPSWTLFADKMRVVLEGLNTGLPGILKTQSARGAQPENASVTVEELTELKQLLDDDLDAARNLLEKIHPGLAALAGDEIIKQLIGFMDAFDFESAQEKLDEIIEQF